MLDLNLPDRRGEEVLRELASAEATSAIPVVIATSETLSREARERLRGAAGGVLQGRARQAVVRKAARIAAPRGNGVTAMTAQTILNVDDNPANRYIRSRALREAGFAVIEAATGQAALR